jgi:hypothetical protein
VLQDANEVPPLPDPGDASGFWQARPGLKHLYEFAQARLVGPWGVLGSTLVRATCAIPPHITLPPTTAGRMSLNMSAALVGGSGVGKGGCDAVARQAIRFYYNNIPIDLPELPIGSGEGIARSLRQADADEDDDRPDTVLFNISEVDTVAALFTRQGSTLEAEQRKVYSGEQLGFSNAQKHTRTRVAAHSYRAGFIFGVQPLRSDALLKGADGGTPQRQIWVPADDLDAPDEDLVEPDPLRVDIPKIEGPHLWTPPEARNEIRAQRRAVLRREPVDPLDGHRLLSRLKVAVALMALDERGEVSLDDWMLAEQVMAMSDRTRQEVVSANADRMRQTNLARADAAADRAVRMQDRVSDAKQKRVARAIGHKLKRVKTATRRELRQACAADIRDDFDPVLSRFVDEEILLCQEGGGNRADTYTLGPNYQW